MHTSKKRKEKKRKKGRCNYANWLASPMVSFWKSVILLNHNGGRVGEQSVPFEDRDSKVEDSLPKGFFFLPSWSALIFIHRYREYGILSTDLFSPVLSIFFLFWLQLNGFRHGVIHLKTLLNCNKCNGCIRRNHFFPPMISDRWRNRQSPIAGNVDSNETRLFNSYLHGNTASYTANSQHCYPCAKIASSWGFFLSIPWIISISFFFAFWTGLLIALSTRLCQGLANRVFLLYRYSPKDYFVHNQTGQYW